MSRTRFGVDRNRLRHLVRRCYLQSRSTKRMPRPGLLGALPPEATTVFVEDEKLLGRIKEAEELSASAEEPMQLKHRWVIENGDLDSLSARASEVSDEQLEQARTRATCDDIATIVVHLRHDRPPRGLPAHPRQFPEPERQHALWKARLRTPQLVDSLPAAGPRWLA